MDVEMVPEGVRVVLAHCVVRARPRPLAQWCDARPIGSNRGWRLSVDSCGERSGEAAATEQRTAAKQLTGDLRARPVPRRLSFAIANRLEHVEAVKGVLSRGTLEQAPVSSSSRATRMSTARACHGRLSVARAPSVCRGARRGRRRSSAARSGERARVRARRRDASAGCTPVGSNRGWRQSVEP